MKLTFYVLFFICIYLSNAQASKIKNINMFDKSRNRNIPTVIYQGDFTNQSVVLINPGYRIKSTEYSFIANSLASLGYFVVSIQHELATDKPSPNRGTLFERRKPFWEQGVKNILYVIATLKKIEPQLSLNQVILIGHSNGGDISMMFAKLNPHKVSKLISLDSRRYPFPRNQNINILRFGASDDEPDEGVVPKSGVQVIYVKGASHKDLCDRGSEKIKKEIQNSIIKFLSK